MPAKFQDWRTHQESAINRGLDSEKRFVAQNAPTGLGKSAIYMAIAQLTGRTCILTSSKGLQDQLLGDFSQMGLVDIRGRANYPCHLSADMTCEEGGHLQCHYQDNPKCPCPYRKAYQNAVHSQLVITNYSYWMAIHKYGEGLGPFDLLVLDESHSAPTEVCDMMSTYFSTEEIYRHLNSRFPADDASIQVWRQWARSLLPRAETAKDQMAEYIKLAGGSAKLREVRLLGTLKNLVTKLQTVATSSGPWVAESTKGGYRLDPLWASDYAQSLLFLDVPKVLMVSATVIPKTLHLLGIGEEDYDFQEYPAVFPGSRNPLIYVPTCRVTAKTFAERDGKENAYVELWNRRIDQLVGDRLDRNGAIHTVSYRRKDLILQRSEYAEYMISHNPSETSDTVKAFKAMRDNPPAILVSPSIDTGYDLPGCECEYQIICKVPYPDTRSRVMAARCDPKTGDSLYSPYITGQCLVQSCGRDMRAPDDRGENIIIDDLIRGFLASYHELLPGWFLRLYRRSDNLPAPPPKLEKRI